MTRKAKGTAPIAEVINVQENINKIKAEMPDSIAAYVKLHRVDLSPMIVKTFYAWQLEQIGKTVEKSKMTQIAFFRVILPDMPEKREEYKAFPGYKTLNYIYNLAAKTICQDAIDHVKSRTASPLEKHIASVAEKRPSHRKGGKDKNPKLVITANEICETLYKLKIKVDTLRSTTSETMADVKATELCEIYAAFVARANKQ
jgi:hypothetical protein